MSIAVFNVCLITYGPLLMKNNNLTNVEVIRKIKLRNAWINELYINGTSMTLLIGGLK